MEISSIIMVEHWKPRCLTKNHKIDKSFIFNTATQPVTSRSSHCQRVDANFWERLLKELSTQAEKDFYKKWKGSKTYV